MGNEASQAEKREPQQLVGPGGRLVHAGHYYSVNRPIGSDSSPPQSTFALNAGQAAPSSLSEDSTAALKSQQQQPQPTQQHRIVVVNSGPRQEALSDELRALGTLPTFLPLIKGSADASASASVSAAVATAAASLAGSSGVDHRSLLHFCARYQEHLKQCAEAVAFDQNSLCVRIKELDSGAKAIQDGLQERHKRFQRLADQIRKVTELRNLLARMRSHARHLAATMEELNSQLPADCQLEPFSWHSTLPQQQQQQLQQRVPQSTTN